MKPKRPSSSSRLTWVSLGSKVTEVSVAFEPVITTLFLWMEPKNSLRSSTNSHRHKQSCKTNQGHERPKTGVKKLFEEKH